MTSPRGPGSVIATVAGTWAWMRAGGEGLDDERAAEIGLSREREQQILADVA